MFVQLRDCMNYFVTDSGDIYSLIGLRLKKLKPFKNRKVVEESYYLVNLRDNLGNRKCKTVHSVVAEVFLGPRLEGMQVNHINGVKRDNRLENLEYCTASENKKHSFAIGLVDMDKLRRACAMGGAAVGARNGKLGAKPVLCSNGERYESASEAASALGISRGHISNVLHGRKKSHCGFTFTFADKIAKEKGWRY